MAADIEAKRFILAIQKSKEDSGPDKGRLFQPTHDLFRAAGLVFQFSGRRLACDVKDASGNDYPLTLVMMPNREIGRAVAEKSADGAVIGFDRFKDIDPQYKGRLRWDTALNFGECNYQIGVDVDSRLGRLITSTGRRAVLEDARDKDIATEHPHALAAIAEERGISLKIHAFTGGVEGARLKGNRRFPFIADLTGSGHTMRDNGYLPQEVLFKSTAGLVYRSRLSPEKAVVFEDLKGRLLRAQEILENVSIQPKPNGDRPDPSPNTLITQGLPTLPFICRVGTLLRRVLVSSLSLDH